MSQSITGIIVLVSVISFLWPLAMWPYLKESALVRCVAYVLLGGLWLVTLMMDGHSNSIGAAPMEPATLAQCSTELRGERLKLLVIGD